MPAGGAAISCVFVVDTAQETQRTAAIIIRLTNCDIWRLEYGFIIADPFGIPRTEKMPARQLESFWFGGLLLPNSTLAAHHLGLVIRQAELGDYATGHSNTRAGTVVRVLDHCRCMGVNQRADFPLTCLGRHTDSSWAIGVARFGLIARSVEAE